MFAQIARAPEFAEVQWINHRPLLIKDLRGKIVLLDFWTFCCINCIHVLPDLKKLEEEFEEELVVIGVHSAKFKEERETANIKEAILRYGINHIIINDRDFAIWESYGVRAWPTLVLIDPKGYVVRLYSGEGHYEEIRNDILKLREEHKDAIDRKKRFVPVPTPKREGILYYPGKVTAAKDFLIISNSSKNEVLVADYGGEILYVIEELSDPQGTRYDGKNLYVANRGAGQIVRVSEHFTKQEVLLENLRSPWDIELKKEVMYIAAAGDHQIYFYHLLDGFLGVYAGNRREGLKDGKRVEAMLAQPSGLSFLGEVLYFVDSETSSLRHIENDEVITDIGQGLFDFGDQDGGRKKARLQHPLGVVTGRGEEGCGAYRIFVADTYNNKIKVYDPVSREIMTLLDGLHEPSGIDKKGCVLYIADTNAHEIVEFDLKSMTRRRIQLFYGQKTIRCESGVCELKPSEGKK